MKKLTIDQARALHGFAPVLWKAVECEDGWTVGTGEAKLVKTNAREVRVFKTLDSVARELRERVGVFSFEAHVLTRGNVDGDGEGVNRECAESRAVGAGTRKPAFWTPAYKPVDAF